MQTQGTRYRDCFLWPYINLEDLTKPRTLLLFMSARGRHQPGEFAAADGEAFHFGITSQAIVPAFLNEHVMMFTGRTEPDTYGQLIPWDDHPDAFDWLHTRKGSHPGEGLLILEIQDRVLSFLVRWAQAILHDIGTENIITEYPVLSEPTPSPGAEAGFASLALVAGEAPYRPPMQLSFERIMILLAAKRDAAADHPWSLREDPGYFAEHMSDCKEHRQEMLLDTQGNPHPLFKSREDILWTRVLGNDVVSTYLELEVWSELYSQAQGLHNMQAKYAKDISAEEDLPEDYMDAILRFHHYLNQAIKGPVSNLKMSLVASPPMRSYFARQLVSDPTATDISIALTDKLSTDSIAHELVWKLRTLWDDGQQLFLMGLTTLVDELQRFIDSNPKASLSSLVTLQLYLVVWPSCANVSDKSTSISHGPTRTKSSRSTRKWIWNKSMASIPKHGVECWLALRPQSLTWRALELQSRVVSYTPWTSRGVARTSRPCAKPRRIWMLSGSRWTSQCGQRQET